MSGIVGLLQRSIAAFAVAFASCPALAQTPSAPLVEAAAKGDANEVRKLIAGGVDLKQRNQHGITPLIISAYRGDTEIVRELLAAKSDPNIANNDEETALHSSAAHANAFEVVPLLIAAGADIEKRDKWGRTPLLVQAMGGRVGAIKALLTAGASPAATDSDSSTAVHNAARNGHIDILGLLHDHDKVSATLGARDRGGNTPLHHAAAGGQPESIKWLSARGLDVRQANTDATRPLALAIGSASWPAVQALLDAGVSLTEPIAKQGGALNVAVVSDRQFMVDLLLKQGAPVDLEVNGFAPLFWAAATGKTDAARSLLRAGANPNLPQQSSKALPLLIAAFAGHLPVVQLLLEHGADIHARNPQGGSAVRSAADSGHLEIVKYLLSKGARADVRDSFGQLPIDYARRKGHAEIVKLLSGTK